MSVSRPRADIGIITVGRELLEGTVVDTNSAEISARLHQLGCRVEFHTTVGDEPGDLVCALEQFGDRATHVIVTGGLGPTVDDRTRQEMATASGVELRFDEESWIRIREYLQGRGVTVVDANRRQARVPENAIVIPNAFGTAPAFRIARPNGVTWWSLPGVPSELEGLLDDPVIPFIERDVAPVREALRQVHRLFRVPEATVDEWFGENVRDGDVAICVRDGEVEVAVTTDRELATGLRDRFGSRYLGSGADDLAARVVEAGSRSEQRVAVAESLTGGWVASRIVSVAGASRVLEAGFVTYSNESKARELGVPASLIETSGPVSPDVAVAMARGALQRTGVSVAAATTGYAGPASFDDEPVGRVFVAVTSRDGAWFHELDFGSAPRSRIRSWSTNFALHGLLQCLRGHAPERWIAHAHEAPS